MCVCIIREKGIDGFFSPTSPTFIVVVCLHMHEMVSPDSGEYIRWQYLGVLLCLGHTHTGVLLSRKSLCWQGELVSRQPRRLQAPSHWCMWESDETEKESLHAHVLSVARDAHGDVLLPTDTAPHGTTRTASQPSMRHGAGDWVPSSYEIGNDMVQQTELHKPSAPPPLSCICAPPLLFAASRPYTALLPLIASVLVLAGYASTPIVQSTFYRVGSVKANAGWSALR